MTRYPYVVAILAMAMVAGILLLFKPGPGPCDPYRTQPELQALCMVSVGTSRR